MPTLCNLLLSLLFPLPCAHHTAAQTIQYKLPSLCGPLQQTFHLHLKQRSPKKHSPSMKFIACSSIGSLCLLHLYLCACSLPSNHKPAPCTGEASLASMPCPSVLSPFYGERCSLWFVSKKLSDSLNAILLQSRNSLVANASQPCLAL